MTISQAVDLMVAEISAKPITSLAEMQQVTSRSSETWRRRLLAYDPTARKVGHEYQVPSGVAALLIREYYLGAEQVA